MIRVIMTGVFLLGIVVSGIAADNEALMSIGNEYYQKGEYDQAIASYQQILNAGVQSGELHYNLGCAYFKMDKIGLALLHFEKARKLLPRDADVAHNLKHTRLFQKDRFDLPPPMPLVSFFSSLYGKLSFDELKSIQILSWLLLISTFIFYYFRKHTVSSKPLMYLITGLSIIFIAVSGWLLDRHQAMNDKHVVILATSADVHSAPLTSSNTLFILHEGTEGQVIQETDDWYEIKLPDGKTGWLPETAVGIF